MLPKMLEGDFSVFSANRSVVIHSFVNAHLIGLHAGETFAHDVQKPESESNPALRFLSEQRVLSFALSVKHAAVVNIYLDGY